MLNKSEALKLAVSKDLALEAQWLCEQQGIPLNVTQAVKAVLQVGIKTTHANLTSQSLKDNTE